MQQQLKENAEGGWGAKFFLEFLLKPNSLMEVAVQGRVLEK